MCRLLAVFMCLIMVSALLYKPIPLSSKPSESAGFKSLINTDIWRQRKYVIWALAIPVALFGYFVPYVHMVCHYCLETRLSGFDSWFYVAVNGFTPSWFVVGKVRR